MRGIAEPACAVLESGIFAPVLQVVAERAISGPPPGRTSIVRFMTAAPVPSSCAHVWEDVSMPLWLGTFAQRVLAQLGNGHWIRKADD